jgi:hypothetical protein
MAWYSLVKRQGIAKGTPLREALFVAGPSDAK